MRRRGFALSIATLLILAATLYQADAATAPVLTVAQVLHDGNPVTSREARITLRDLSGHVEEKGLKAGDRLPDEVTISVPASDAVVVSYTEAGRNSTATFEPGSKDTLWYTGTQEMVMVQGGVASFTDPLSFFHVQAPSLSLAHNLTVFSVDVEPTRITVTCTADSVDTELLASATGPGSGPHGGTPVEHVGRVDTVAANGTSSITYKVTNQGVFADVALSSDEAAASRGDATAEYDIGNRFYDGQGVTRNYVTALHWYRLAAARGFAAAENGIGYMYYEGQGISQNYPTALSWFRRAANQGDAVAEYNVGSTYDNGTGVRRDYKTALRWFRLAADQGLDTAEYDIGYLYETGHGVPRDYAAALHWYKLAAAQGDSRTEYMIGTMYYFGEGVVQDHAAALYWFRLAAAQGLPAAEYTVGYMYEHGLGTPQNDANALRWYRLAAAQGYTDAQAALERVLRLLNRPSR